MITGGAYNYGLSETLPGISEHNYCISAVFHSYSLGTSYGLLKTSLLVNILA